MDAGRVGNNSYADSSLHSFLGVLRAFSMVEPQVLCCLAVGSAVGLSENARPRSDFRISYRAADQSTGDGRDGGGSGAADWWRTHQRETTDGARC